MFPTVRAEQPEVDLLFPSLLATYRACRRSSLPIVFSVCLSLAFSAASSHRVITISPGAAFRIDSAANRTSIPMRKAGRAMEARP